MLNLQEVVFADWDSFKGECIVTISLGEARHLAWLLSRPVYITARAVGAICKGVPRLVWKLRAPVDGVPSNWEPGEVAVQRVCPGKTSRDGKVARSRARQGMK